MNDKLLKGLLRQQKKHHRWIAIVLLLSLVVSLGTVTSLRLEGEARTYTRRVLDCPCAYDGAEPVAHVHNDDCRNEAGNLICTLPEIIPHEHTPDCYIRERGELICGLEENEGHHHDDSCYEWHDVLICGETELPVHIHNADCFRIEEIDLKDELEETDEPFVADEPEGSAEAELFVAFDMPEEEEEPGEPQELPDPAQNDEFFIMEDAVPLEITDGAEGYYIPDSDDVNEPENTPADEIPEEQPTAEEAEITEEAEVEDPAEALQADPVNDEPILTEEAEIPEEPAALPEDGEAAQQNESDLEGEAEIVEEYVESTDAAEETAGFANAMPAQAFDVTEAGIRVQVDAPEGAFPADTRMEVTPVSLEEMKADIENAIESEVLEVQAVDIKFYDPDGFEIEPLLPIRVTIIPAESEYADRTAQVVHIDKENVPEVIEQAEDALPENERELVFDAESFSIYAVVYSTETYYKSVTGDTYHVSLDYDKDAGIPRGAALAVSEILEENEKYTEYLTQAEGAVGESKQIRYARFFDISILSGGEEIQPLGPVSVKIELTELTMDTTLDDSALQVLHFSEPGAAPEVLNAEADGENISFETEGFSVYGVVYTVDFTYSVNGKMYELSLPGGGFITLHHLIEALGINEEMNGADTDRFIADIQNVEFSNPSLIWVGKTEEDSTVGQLKSDNGLSCEYSSDLTEEQIEEINREEIPSGEWVLISLKPFTSEETLTVTMNDGEVFIVKVTDAQISTYVLTADGVTFRITVTFDDAAEIPEGTTLEAEEIEYGSDEYLQYLGRTWSEVNRAFAESMGQSGDSTEGRYINVNTARFFDITLVYEGEEIEPKAPVRVEITYVDGLPSWDNTRAGVVHFTQEKGIEILRGVEADVENDAAVSFRYEQDSFSVIGTYIQQETHDAETPPLGSTSSYSLPAVRSVRAADSAGDGDESEPKEDLLLALAPLDLRAGGDTETPATEDDSGLPLPQGNKSLTPNDDGTYTLTLSVKGSSQTTIQKKQKKANVLFVMDRSSSMITNTVDDEDKFWYYGTRDTAEFRQDIGDPNHTTGKNYQFYGLVNGEYVQLNANFTNWRDVNFSYWDGTYDNVWYYPYQVEHYEPYPSDAPLYVQSKTTRLYAEQDALNDVISSLLAYNTEEQDTVEIAVISFADHRSDTKGWTDTEYTDWVTGTNNSGIMEKINSTRYASGTNWEEALQYAYATISEKKTAEANKPEEDYYVVFLTDGEPTNMVGDTSAAQHTGDNGNKEAYDAAKDDALALVRDGYKFYNIFTYRVNEPVKYSKYLTNYAYSNGTSDYDDNTTEYTEQYFSDAQTIDALKNTFHNIFLTIADVIGHASVSITDTLTTDAMTTTVVQGRTNGYVYTVEDPSGTVLYTVTATGDLSSPTVTFHVPGSETETYTATATPVGDGTLYSITTAEGQNYRIALADVNNTTGELEWDLSPVGILMNDCTYSISFVVWPDQDAYDYVAALNNGLAGYTWDESSAYDSGKGYQAGGVSQYPSIVKYPDGPYAVLTNTDQKVHYSVVEMETINGEPNGDPEVHGPYYSDLQTPDPMPLTASESSMEKVWNVERDPGILAQLLYETDGSSSEFAIEYDIMRGNEEEPYVSITLGWDEQLGEYVWEPGSVRNVTYSDHTVQVGTRWAADFAIATGLMLSEEHMDARGLDKSAYPSGTWEGTRYYILETGHDYTITEKIDEESASKVGYEFDFVSPVYHPMLVDGVLRSVNYTASENSITITGMTDASADLQSLQVQNTLRGYINLEKLVVDKDGVTALPEDETKFEYSIELRNSTDPGPFTVAGDHVPWYGINRLFYHDADFNYYQAYPTAGGIITLTDAHGNTFSATSDDFNESVGPATLYYTDNGVAKELVLYGNQMTRDSDNYVHTTIKIAQGEVLNIANVPVGTVYTITETDASGYDFVNVRREIRNGSQVESGSILSGSTTVTGTIVADRDNHIIYKNKLHSVDLTVKKVDENDMPLTGAVFSLYRKDGDTWLQEPAATMPGAGETDLATYEFINLDDGSYKLVETAPAGYAAVDDVFFTVANGALTFDGTLPAGVTRDENRLLLTVKNMPLTDSLTVRKQWLDVNGNPRDYNGTLDLKLVQWVPGDPPEHTVQIYFRHTGNGNGGIDFPGQIKSIGDRQGSGIGNVTIQWSWNQYTMEQPFDVDGLEGSTYSSSWTANPGRNDGRQGTQTLTISNITKDLTIYVTIRNNNYDGTNNSLIGQLQFAGSSSEATEKEPTGGTKTITLGANGAWSQQFTVSGDGLLSDETTALPATCNGKNCSYSIAEESVPDGYVLQQISTDKLQSGVLTAYNQRTSEDVTVTVRKVWEDGTNQEDGTQTNHGESLTVVLSNGQEVTLNDENNWEASISGLPKYDHEGNPIEYSWTEGTLPHGYYLSNTDVVVYDNEVTTTLTNSYSDHYMPEMEIDGVKVWDDNGDSRPESITVNLYKDGELYLTTTVNPPTDENADPDQWAFKFTNLPIFNEDWTLAAYTVEEVLPAGYTADYETAIQQVTATYEAGTAEAHIINSYTPDNHLLCEGADLGFVVVRHGQDYVVWTPRPLMAGELDRIRTAAVNASSQFSGIMDATGSSLTIISGVPKTVSVGNKEAATVYMKDGDVWVRFKKSSAQSDLVYGSIPYTYTQIGGEGGVTITNVRKVTSVSGTKTWIDGGRDHHNADEITLRLYRTPRPVTTDSVWDEVPVPETGTTGPKLTWNGNTYTYSNLPRYDTGNPTAEYEYRVEETAVSVTEGTGTDQHTISYKMETEGNDFTNTELTNIEATKTWKQGETSANAAITNASVTFELQRKNGDTWERVAQDGLTNPVTMAVGNMPNAQAWRATWNNLPRYEMTAGTAVPIQYRVVETAAILAGKDLTPGEPVNVTDGTANIDNDLFVDLTILKVDSNGMTTPLEGATFTIQRIDESSAVLSLLGDPVTAATTGKDAVETGTDGRAEFTGLTAGYYIVKETKLPDGYVQSGTGSFYVKVENGEVKLVERGSDGWVESGGNAKLTFTAARGSAPATVTVGNDAGVALPNTGGEGTMLFTVFGTICILTATLGILANRRKREDYVPRH